MTSFMIGDDVRRHPDMAADGVRRGHEAGTHGRRWERQYEQSRPEEAALDRRQRHRVWWASKDDIAQSIILDHPDTATWVERDPAPVSGLPGRNI